MTTIASMYESGVVKGKQVVLDCMIDNFDTTPFWFFPCVQFTIALSGCFFVRIL